MSNAAAGVGSKFRRLVTSIYEEIAEITNIDGPTMTRETIDVTNMDSTDGYREFLGSLRDGGSVSIEMNFTRNAYDTLKTDFEDDDLNDYEILLSDPENTSFNFQALITDLSVAVPVDDKISMSATFKISGIVNENSGSGSS